MTKAKMSCALLDIQRLKRDVIVVQSSSKGKTYFCLVYSTKLIKTSFEKFFEMEIPLEDIYAYKASSTIHFQQTILVSYF